MPLFPPNIAKLKARGDVDGFIKALRHKGLLRLRAVWALVELADPRTLEPLAALLDDGDALVWWNAATGLARMGDPRAVEPLIASFGDPKLRSSKFQKETMEALLALARVGDARIVSPLAELLGKDHLSGELSVQKDAVSLDEDVREQIKTSAGDREKDRRRAPAGLSSRALVVLAVLASAGFSCTRAPSTNTSSTTPTSLTPKPGMQVFVSQVGHLRFEYPAALRKQAQSPPTESDEFWLFLPEGAGSELGISITVRIGQLRSPKEKFLSCEEEPGTEGDPIIKCERVRIGQTEWVKIESDAGETRTIEIRTVARGIVYRLIGSVVTNDATARQRIDDILASAQVDSSL